MKVCSKCHGALSQDAKDMWVCTNCGLTGSIAEMERKAEVYRERLVEDVYQRYSKNSARQIMGWWLQPTFKSIGVDLKRCVTEEGDINADCST